MTDELPVGWVSASLSEITSTIQYGYTASAEQKPHGPRFLRITDIQDGRVDWDSVPSCEINSADLAKYRLADGDIVFARSGATTGKSYLIRQCPKDAVFASYLIRVRPTEAADPAFLSFYFQTSDYWHYIAGNTAGNAQPNCNGSKLAKLPVVLPPLAEQRRIVAKLDTLMAEVNASRKYLNNVPTIIKRFGQSVLAAACSGRLTAKWRGDDSLVEDLPAQWRRVALDELVPPDGIFDGPFGSNLKSSDYTQSGVRVIRLENVGVLRFNGEKESFVSLRKYEELKRHAVDEGDIIFASFIDEEIRACLIPKLSTKAIAKADCFCVRPKADVVNRKYLLFQLASQESYDALFEGIHGATRPRINTSQLRMLMVRMCPRAEQEEIVRRVDALFAHADGIEKEVGAATSHADKLTRSILAKALLGELVPTEAEVARQEGRDYESASALLERIRSSKAGGYGIASAGPRPRKRRVAPHQ